MPSPDFGQFIRLLYRATDRQQAHWEPTQDEDSIQVRVGTGVMRLSRSTYRDTFLLELIDQQGKVIEQYEPLGEEDVNLAKALFRKGRIQALDLEHVIERFYNQVKAMAGE